MGRKKKRHEGYIGWKDRRNTGQRRRLSMTRLAGANHSGKMCTGGCQRRLTLKSFASNASNEDGLESECRDCRARYRQFREHILKRETRRYRRLNLLSIRYGSYMPGAQLDQRLEEFLWTGKVPHRRADEAQAKREKIRLIFGKLRIVEGNAD